MVTRADVWAEVRRWWSQDAAVHPLNRLGMATAFAGLFLAGAASGPPGAWRWWLAGGLALALYAMVLGGLVQDWADARARLERRL